MYRLQTWTRGKLVLSASKKCSRLPSSLATRQCPWLPLNGILDSLEIPGLQASLARVHGISHHLGCRQVGVRFSKSAHGFCESLRLRQDTRNQPTAAAWLALMPAGGRLRFWISCHWMRREEPQRTRPCSVLSHAGCSHLQEQGRLSHRRVPCRPWSSCSSHQA